MQPKASDIRDMLGLLPITSVPPNLVSIPSEQLEDRIGLIIRTPLGQCRLFVVPSGRSCNTSSPQGDHPRFVVWLLHPVACLYDLVLHVQDDAVLLLAQTGWRLS